MAWTNPRTWTDGEFVTKAIMDVHVRDNLNAIAPRFHIRKTADKSVISSATLQNDDHLLFAIGASEVWAVDLLLFYTNNNNGNAKLQAGWSVPAACTGTWSWQAYLTTPPGISQGDALTIATAATGLGTTQTADQPVMIHATIVNSTNAGTVNFQFAQTVIQATNTTVKTNSRLIAERIA